MDRDTIRTQKLNELIEVCNDGRRGFWQAASDAVDRSYRELFRKKALQRNAFAVELQDTALKLGIKPSREGTLGGRLHRAWMNFRHHLNPHHDKVVLLECQRGEEHALTVYQDVFENHLLPEIQQVLEQQFLTMIKMRNDLASMTAKNRQTEFSGSMLHLL